MITIRVDTTPIDRIAERLEHLGSGGMLPIIARALNRSGDAAATAVSRTLADETGVGVRTARAAISTDKATAGDLSYTLTIKGDYLTLAEFKPRETSKGVTAAPWGKRRLYEHAFIAKEDVFIREGRPRLPIRPLFGPSLAVEAQRGASVEVATATAHEVFERRIQHEVGRALKGRGGE